MYRRIKSRIMKNIAFIPVRGGSKSIPLKNIKMINGRPLVYWALLAAIECKEIDKVFVATDSDTIRETVEKFGFNKVEVVSRSQSTATETASTESAMLEFAEKYEFENIILIQATSPLLTSEDLQKGLEMFALPQYDSILSVVRQKRFVWKENEEGIASPVNYDVYHRPRRQEFDGYLVENGAFYMCSRESLLRTGNRLSGNIGVVEMREESYFEIDEPSDWTIIEKFLADRKAAASTGHKIKMVLTDCDGCLTDGGMYYSDSGSESKKFNTKDGMGFQRLRERGIITGIITGEKNAVVSDRGEKLQLDIVKLGVKDKKAEIENLCREYGITLKEVAYIGDDVNDLEAIRSVGFGCSVSNAMECVKKEAQYVSPLCGGDGAVRDIIEHIITIKEDGR